MSIIEIDQRKFPGLAPRARLSWQHRFRRNLYQANYARAVQPAPELDLLAEDRKNQAVVNLVRFIGESRQKGVS